MSNSCYVRGIGEWMMKTLVCLMWELNMHCNIGCDHQANRQISPETHQIWLLESLQVLLLLCQVKLNEALVWIKWQLCFNFTSTTRRFLEGNAEKLRQKFGTKLGRRLLRILIKDAADGVQTLGIIVR